MRISQNIIVLGLIVAMLGLGAVIISLRSGKSHREAMKNSLKAGLEQVFDKVAVGKENAVHPDDLKSVLGDRSKALLPSFVNRSEVFIADAPINISSEGVICAVKLNDGTYLGLIANRQVKTLSQDQINSWPHHVISPK